MLRRCMQRLYPQLIKNAKKSKAQNSLITKKCRKLNRGQYRYECLTNSKKNTALQLPVPIGGITGTLDCIL
jgi:hypothetical protein